MGERWNFAQSKSLTLGIARLSSSQKNGDYRLCIDLKNSLNPASKTDVFPLPTLDGIYSALYVGAVYCVLDLTESYTGLRVNCDSEIVNYQYS